MTTVLESVVAPIVRKTTGSICFWKSLPKFFGNQRILVTSRSDIRLLAPGFSSSSHDLLEIAKREVDEGSVVWDIGSNLGIFAFCASITSGVKGEVYSLEADPKYAEIQQKTLLRLTEKAANVNILCAAAADKVGLLELSIPKKGHARNHLSVVSGNNAGAIESTKQVPTLTLDWLLNYWKSPDFVKIDVEGAEILVANGAEKLFSEIRPSAYIECSHENSQWMTEKFKKWGYSFLRLEKNGDLRKINSFAFNTLVKPS